ncbi:hypothetical protein [Sphingomonas lenta]|nr:hypothetical protein [Sphingomonas lenta]
MEGTTSKRQGLLTRRERLSVLLGVPLLTMILCVEIARVWAAVLGKPLLITSFIDPDLTVEWSANPYLFLLGLGLHGFIILFVAAALWVQSYQAWRWLRSRH